MNTALLCIGTAAYLVTVLAVIWFKAPGRRRGESE